MEILSKFADKYHRKMIMKYKVASIQKRLSVTLLMVVCGLLIMQAQEFTIDAVELNPFDLTGGTAPRADFNGVNCAVVKVKVPLEGCVFEGDYIGQIEHSGGEYIIYFIDGTKKFKIKHNRLKEKEVYFPDWKISSLMSECTYEVRASVPQYLLSDSQPTMQDVGAAYFVLSVTPKEGVSVRIDGELQSVDDGVIKKMLKNGVHSYSVEAGGYESQQGNVTIASEKVERRIVLESVLATLNVTSNTPQAMIYIDDVYKSSDSWSGVLSAGMYNVTLRKEGYRDASQIVELRERENRNLTFQAMMPIYGALNVDYKPVGSSVRIDGKVVGTTPDIFNNLVAGNHEVTVSHVGYKDEKRTVRIEENQTLTLTGTLTQANLSGDVQTYTVNGVSFDMVSVEGGTFTMGATSEQGGEADSDETPTHQVTLSDYMIGQTEVTQKLWQAVMGSNPSYFKGDNLPVETVSWNDCQDFVNKLNELTQGSRPEGMVFRLPTEAEWEYAARGGKSEGCKYSGSNTIDNVAWYTKTTNDSGTKAVGTKSANELGLCDMSGNVWEWCYDLYGDYSGGSQTNPKGPSTGSSRVRRGGSWNGNAGPCRVSFRGYGNPGYWYDNCGVRVCLGRVL